MPRSRGLAGGAADEKKGFGGGASLVTERAVSMSTMCFLAAVTLTGAIAVIICGRTRARSGRPFHQSWCGLISDPDIDAATRADVAARTGCIAGALTEVEFRAAVERVGLLGVEIRESHRVHEHAAPAIRRARRPV